MERLLVHPPFADPTQPYLSLPTLKGHLRSVGLDARVVDLNVEAAHHLLAPETVEEVARDVGRKFQELNRSESLSFRDARQLRSLAAARPGLESLLGADPSPLEVFRRRDLFLDPGRYVVARRQVEALFDALSALHFPFRFGFNRHGHEALPWGFDLLEDYVSARRSPLDGFYRSLLDGIWDPDRGGPGPISAEDHDFIGISIAFPSQIPEALYLARLFRERAPRAFIALGGPCLHQVAFHLEPPLLARLLAFADGLGLFEGEETLSALFPLLAEWREAADGPARLRVLAGVPNLLLPDPSSPRGAHLGPPHQVDLREAAAPDYSDLDLDRYLAPARIVLYAPTRGCYWAKCSFCYYGLAESATARYREVPPERAASDLAKLSRRHGVRHVYISCDVL